MNFHRLTALAATFFCGAVVAGCGSDVPRIDIDAMKDAAEGQQDAGQGDTSSKALKPIEFLLPETSDVPNGFREVPSLCETDSDASKYRGWYNFAVPEDWEAGGVTGGSSAPLSEGTKLSFGTGSDRAVVEVESDPMSSQGTIGDGQGGEWTTFDYDYKVGDTTTSVKFDEFSTASIDGQDVTILAAPYQQARELLKVTEYKARINAATIYGRFHEADRGYTSSLVVTIKPTRADRELKKDLVTGIVGSFTMPTCVRDLVVVDEEVRINKDVDGDGQVATIEDWRELTSQS